MKGKNSALSLNILNGLLIWYKNLLFSRIIGEVFSVRKRNFKYSGFFNHKFYIALSHFNNLSSGSSEQFIVDVISEDLKLSITLTAISLISASCL